MLGTTARLASAVIMSSVILSMHRLSLFHSQCFNEVIRDAPQQPVVTNDVVADILPLSSSPPPVARETQPESQSSPLTDEASSDSQSTSKETDILPTSSSSSPPQSLRGNAVQITENTGDRTTGQEITKISEMMKTSSAVDLGDFTDDGGAAFSDDYGYDSSTDRKRAIVLISMGEKASNTTMVERFVWSARNIGKYTGWIVLITDADKERYADLDVAAIPDAENQNFRLRTLSEDQNTFNNFLVFRTEEPRFKRITKFKPFRPENTMSSKIFKTYILQYASKELRLNEVELFYYLDVDIVFGNDARLLFTQLEKRYNIGRLHRGRLSNDDDSSLESTAKEPESGKIYFFKGNGKIEIQGGQFVMDRKRSQPCLGRWRQLMQKQRREKVLKDQMQLTMMLKEQRERAAELAANSTLSLTKKDCEIIIMDQDKTLITFPELNDITKSKKGQEHATLIHFRNSANVMKKVDESNFDRYMRDILRFDDGQEDTHGLLGKMMHKVDDRKKSF